MLGAEAEVPSAIGSRSEAEDGGHEDEEHEDEEEGDKEGTGGEEASERPPLSMKKNGSVSAPQLLLSCLATAY